MNWIYMSYGIEGPRIGSKDNILKMVKRSFLEAEAFFKGSAS